MPELAIDEAINLGLDLHRQGRLVEAEAIYRGVLLRQPNQPSVLHLLGLVAYQMGLYQPAISLIRQAIDFDPASPEYYANCGLALTMAGRLDEAVASFQQSISLAPDVPEVHFHLGSALGQQRQFALAIAAFTQALRRRPEYPEALHRLGMALAGSGQYREAVDAYGKAIDLQPNDAALYFDQANALRDLGEPEQAISAYRRALDTRFDYPEAHNNLGAVLALQKRHEAAVGAYRQALKLRPNYSEAHYNLGMALQRLQHHQQAIESYRSAIAYRPDFSEAFCNLGHALFEQGELAPATAAYRQAISIDADYAEAHANLSVPLLLQGDLKQGWAEYEWRWRCKTFRSPRRHFTQPQWNGSALRGRRILSHAEQGFGDTIHFSRYASIVARQGAKVILECQPQLYRLLGTLPGVDLLIQQGDSLPEFDVHCPLMSLPLACRTTLISIPASSPYLRADPQQSCGWGGRIKSSAAGLRVGLVWAGSPTNTNDSNRSLRLRDFEALGEIAGVTFFSLQKGPASAQAHAAPPRLSLVDFTADLHDFADTAALVANLDLIITVDTAIAHLAGALGKPAWVLLAMPPDFRWLLDRPDSPWYPSLRLFRQSTPRDWSRPLREVAAALQTLAQTSAAD